MCRQRRLGQVVTLLAILVSTNGPVEGLAQSKGKGGGGADPAPVVTNPAIAFVAADARRSDVYVAAADRASEIALTRSLEPRRKGRLHMGNPAWSPDGKEVAFWVWDRLSETDIIRRLYIARADGTSIRVVRDLSIRPAPGSTWPHDWLDWSPSGRELVYKAGGRWLVAVDVTSGDDRILFAPPPNLSALDHPALSPDIGLEPGYQGLLAVSLGYQNSAGQWSRDIFAAPVFDNADGYLLPIDANSFVNLTQNPESVQMHPAWSPEGTELAHFDNEELSIVDWLTGEKRTLPGGYRTNVSDMHRATWTSDSSRIVYMSNLFGDWTLSIIAADGTELPQKYTPGQRDEWAPAWNPRWDPSGPGKL
jgi:Tol biopolymer transport system component